MFDNYGYLLAALGSYTNKAINDAENMFNIDINNDGLKGSLVEDNLQPISNYESFDIDLNIDYASFERYGISRDMYEPYILEAASIWEEYITKGLPDVIAGDFYGDLGPAVFSYENELVGDYIDDIAITFQAFDFGDDYVLGDAIPTEIRYEMDQQGNTTKIGLPSQGTIRFNTSSYLYDYYDITSLTVHEIAHVLGFGTLWYNDYGVLMMFQLLGISMEGDIIDYYGDYVGEHALAAYSDYLGFTADYIPVEQSYGPGSAYVHWDEQYFEWDIMSYAQTDGPQELSIQ